MASSKGSFDHSYAQLMLAIQGRMLLAIYYTDAAGLYIVTYCYLGRRQTMVDHVIL